MSSAQQVVDGNMEEDRKQRSQQNKSPNMLKRILEFVCGVLVSSVSIIFFGVGMSIWPDEKRCSEFILFFFFSTMPNFCSRYTLIGLNSLNQFIQQTLNCSIQKRNLTVYLCSLLHVLDENLYETTKRPFWLIVIHVLKDRLLLLLRVVAIIIICLSSFDPSNRHGEFILLLFSIPHELYFLLLSLQRFVSKQY